MASSQTSSDSRQAYADALKSQVAKLRLEVPTLATVTTEEVNIFKNKVTELSALSAKLEAAQDEIILIQNGKYYAATKKVWKTKTHNLACDLWGNWKAETWRKLVRKTVDIECIAMSKQRKRAKLYESTKEHAEGQYESISVKSARSTATHDTKAKLWPKDVGGNQIDRYAEGAHLLPAGTSDHVDWFRIGGAAVGLDETNSDVVKMLKATRGCKNPDRKDKKRFDCEGVLHFVSNRLYLTHQKHLIDGMKPQMMVVPVLSLDEIRDWDGKKYNAIILVGEPNSDTSVDNPMTDDEIHMAFQSARLVGDTLVSAAPEQVKDAAAVLKEGVIALGEMILSMNPGELDQVETFDRASAERLRKARASLENCGGVQVPEVMSENLEENDCRVLLVPFDGHNEEQPRGHVAPDPLLLLLKAANVFGRLTGMNYLANGTIPCLDSESDVEQIELYASLLNRGQETSDTPTGMVVGVH